MKDASNQSSIRRTGVQTPQQEHGDSKEVQVPVHVHIQFQFQFRSEYSTCLQKLESILLRSRVQIEHGHFCLCDNTTTCVYYKGVWVWRVSFLVLIWDGLIRIGNWMILFLAGWSSLFISVVECYFLQDCYAHDPTQCSDYYAVSLVVSLRSEAGTVILKHHYLGGYSWIKLVVCVAIDTTRVFLQTIVIGL